MPYETTDFAYWFLNHKVVNGLDWMLLVSRSPFLFNNIYFCICLCVFIYNTLSTYVCFLSWVSCYFVMRKLSLTSLVSEMTNYNEVDDSQYKLYICICFFHMLKIKYLGIKWSQRHQIRPKNKMKNYETANGNFISLATLISGCFRPANFGRWQMEEI